MIYFKSCQGGICKHICSKEFPAAPVRTARIKTDGTFQFKYGHVEVRVRLPRGDWLWPAIWLIPSRSIYGSWPRSGEMDMMESAGNSELINNVASTLHFGTNSSNSAWRTSHFSKYNKYDWDDDFHLYQMVWGPGNSVYNILCLIFMSILFFLRWILI